MVFLVRSTTKKLNLQKYAIDADLAGSNSLQGKGVMALGLHRYDTTIIIKLG